MGSTGTGSCYVEFGGDRVGRIDVDFFSGPKPTGNYIKASEALVREKEDVGSSRQARWFGSTTDVANPSTDDSNGSAR